MRRLIPLAVSLVALACGSSGEFIEPAHPPPLAWPVTLGDAAWLAGDWAGQTADGGCAVERWTAPAGGDSMLGYASVAPAKGGSYSEIMRMMNTDYGVALIALADTDAPVRFDLIWASDRFLRFENSANPYPKAITYMGTPGGLEITLSGGGSAPQVRTRYIRSAACR